MSENENKQKTVWTNVGVAHMSKSGKSLILNMSGRDHVINLESLNKVISGEESIVNISIAQNK